MNQILPCDWLPEHSRWSYLACSGLPAVSRKEHFPKSHVINPLLTKFVRSRWLDIGLVLFFASLWTSTASRFINTRKKRTWPISSHLDRTNLVNNPYFGFGEATGDPYSVTSLGGVDPSFCSILQGGAVVRALASHQCVPVQFSDPVPYVS